MSVHLSPARDQVLLHLDYLGESAALIEGFAQRAQATQLSDARRSARRPLTNLSHHAADVLNQLEAAEKATSEDHEDTK